MFVFQPGIKMVSSAKSSVPTVTDQAAAMQLGQCAKNLATCLAELRTAAQAVLNLSSHKYLISRRSKMKDGHLLTLVAFQTMKTYFCGTKRYFKECW